VSFSHSVEQVVGNPRALLGTKQRRRFEEEVGGWGYTREEAAGGEETAALPGKGGDGKATAGELSLQLLRPRRHPSAPRTFAPGEWWVRWAGIPNRY
jgi:hypothetical protein